MYVLQDTLVASSCYAGSGHQVIAEMSEVTDTELLSPPQGTAAFASDSEGLALADSSL